VARLAPGNLAARSRLALTYERLGRPAEAIQEYIAVGSILQKGDKKERAIEAVQRALMLKPGDPDASVALRLLREDKPLPAPHKPRGVTSPLRAKKSEKTDASAAQAALKQARGTPSESQVAAAPAEPLDAEALAESKALSVLAGLLFEEPAEGGKKERESPGLTALVESTRGKRKSSSQQQSFRYLGEAIDLKTRGHKRRAAKLFERAIEAGVRHPAVYYVLGLLYRELGSFEDARKCLAASLESPDLALGANLALGRLARSEGNLPEAAQYLLQALRMADAMSVEKGQSAQLNDLYDSMMASLGTGDEEALKRIVESALGFLEGPDWLSRVRQARLQLQRQAQDARIIPIAEMLARGGTQQVIEDLQNIDQLIADGHLTPAMEELMFCMDRAPGFLGLHMRMAELMMKSGHSDAALHKMELVAQTHELRGESPKAAEVLTKVLEYSPVDTGARQRLIHLLVAQDKIEEALDQCMQQAEFHRQMAQLEEARQALQAALDLGAQHKVDRFRQLTILHHMGDIDLARLDWRRALQIYGQVRKLDPDDEKASRIMVDLHLRLGQESQAAKELDSHLDHLVNNGRGSEALSMLEEMTREYPGKQMLHARLAEAYRAADRKADAIAQYDALGEIQLDAGQVQDAIRTIRTIIELAPPDLEGYHELLRNLEATGRS
jgi:tetratricopeptide (TPR) repeat protein